jgi:CBS domain containing-hemolysin-like protein
MALLIIFFLVSILFSFLCSVWEAVLLSITPAYISQQKQAKTTIGRDLELFKRDIDRPLSAILTLNTIAHTVGAIGVGAQAGKMFGENEFHLGFIHLSYESIIAGVMTLAILVLSEIIPKTIGANLWRTLAPFTIRSLKILLIILFPFVWLSQQITRTLKKDKTKSVFSRADFKALTHAGEESGALDRKESTIIKNLLRFEAIQVKNIMTPRTVMIMADEEMTLQEFYNRHEKLRFSRIPIYTNQPDNISGFFLKDELLENLVKDNDNWQLHQIRKDVLAVNQDKPLPELFDALTQNRAHMAIVVDDFGSLVGLVSMEDVFETLLGLEIVDESDAVADLQELARKRWEERARKIGLVD